MREKPDLIRDERLPRSLLLAPVSLFPRELRVIRVVLPSGGAKNHQRWNEKHELRTNRMGFAELMSRGCSQKQRRLGRHRAYAYRPPSLFRIEWGVENGIL